MLFFIIISIIYSLIRLGMYLNVIKSNKFSYNVFFDIGFQYNLEKDIFCFNRNVWLKNFVYFHIFDVLALIFKSNIYSYQVEDLYVINYIKYDNINNYISTGIKRKNYV